MDKYEYRRQRLIRIRDEICGGKAVEIARRINREPSYVSRMLYPEDKKGKKRIADDMVEIIESSFSLARGWMDGLNDGEANPGNRPLSPELTNAERELIEMLRGLPENEVERFRKDVQSKKEHYDSIFEEMLKKRQHK
ncbi:TPA: hypothetical protein ACG0BA_002201 [Serratia odorifera]